MTYEVLIIAVVGVILSAFAKRFSIPSELFLVIVMGIISFVPFLPRITFEGGAMLQIILPPLLFSAARNLSGYKFRKVRNPVVWLGVGLIFLTAFVVAFVADIMTGYMTLSAGLILGAVVSPPDAVSSISIGKKLGLPDRVMSILTGESLINDAAALTLFSIAVTITYEENSSIDNPLQILIYTGGGGILLGFLMGIIAIYIRKILVQSNIVAIFTLLMPFLIYFIAEHLSMSGVLAVVIAGFMIEKTSFVTKYQTRIQERSLWSSVETLLESFVFAYIGLQIKFILEDLNNSELDTVITIIMGFGILLTVLLVRPVGVLFYNAIRIIYYHFQYLHLQNFAYRRDANMSKRVRDNLVDAPMSWREYIILSWAGMRGVVTLATASAVPIVFVNTDFSYQSDAFKIHIFIQVAGLITAVGTLLIQGLSLPHLVNLLLPKKKADDKVESKYQDPLEGQWGKGRQILDETAIRVIEDEYSADPSFDKEHFIKVWNTLDSASIAKSKHDISFVSQLFMQIANQQRLDIQEAANNGSLHPDVAREFINRLDIRMSTFD